MTFIISGLVVLLGSGTEVPPSAATGSWTAVIVVMAGLTLVMIMTARRTRASRGSGNLSVRELMNRSEQEHQTRRDLESLTAELDQLARQIHGRLDTALVRLEMVIRDADERCHRLGRLIRAADGQPTIDVTVGGGLGEDKAKSGERGDLVAEGGLRTEGGGDAAVESGTADPGLRRPRRFEEVVQLSEQGLSIPEIAAQTGRTAGEVELILSLGKVQGSDSDQSEHALGRGC